jgi:serine protease Do
MLYGAQKKGKLAQFFGVKPYGAPRAFVTVWRLPQAALGWGATSVLKDSPMKHMTHSWLSVGMLLAIGTPAWLAAAEKLSAVTRGSESARDLGRLSGEIESLSVAVGPKVVQIATQSLKVAGAGEQQPAGLLVAEHGRGSGFFVTSDGYVLTNAHVVANATRVTVLVAAVNGSAQGETAHEYPGNVVGVDADNDLALLKIDVEGVPFFDLSRVTTAHQGQLVLAYGNPLGLSQSASLGLVSAVERQLNPEDPRTYIQTDASLNPGNSGGPLVDLEGKLLGINTMIISQSGGSEGIGFAVPLDVIRHSYAGLREKGMVVRSRLGIQPRSLTADLIGGLGLKSRRGVLVEDVDPSGPGATAGLLQGDVMLSLNAEPVNNIRDLYRVESGLSAGTEVDLWVMRGESARALRITPQPGRPATPATLAGNVTEKENLVLRLGMYGSTLTPALVSTLGGLRKEQGVLVLALAGLGLTGQNALEPGDVVHAVNGCAVDGVESLRQALETIPDSAAVVVQIERAGMLSYVTPGGLPGSEQRLKKTGATLGRAWDQPADARLRY